MAELDTLTFEGVESASPVVNENILKEEVEKEKDKEIIETTSEDSLQFEGVESETPPQEEIITTTETEETVPTFQGVETAEGLIIPDDSDISNWERLEYGWDKETMVLGNVFRVGKAYVQDIFDDDKTFKDYIVENEKKRLEAIDKEHWKFRGREDEGGITTVGSIASMILDPYYLAGYLNPYSLKAMTNPISSATLNALLISGDVIIDNLAKTGEVDWNEVALTGATAGAIGAVIPIGGKIIKKYAPKFLESEVKLVADFIDRKIAKTNNISTSQLKKIQTVSQSAEVKAADKELIKWTRNFVHPITAETKKFRALEKTLLEKRNLLIKVRKLTGRKKPKPGVPGMLTQESPGKQIIKIRQEIIDAKKASEIVKKDLIIKQQDKLKTWSNLVSNRNIKILEQLRKNETSIDWAARTLFSATVRPLVGAGMGTVGGILFGDEETDLMYWAAAGAVAGQMQKMIAKSAKFGTKLEKGKILGVIDRELTQLTLQKVRDLMSSTSSTKLDSYGGATRDIGKLLLREVDSPVSQKSVIAIADQMQRHFFRKADKIFTGYTDDEIAWAISINRGKQLTKETPKRVEDLSKNIKGYIDEFRGLSEGAGFFPKKELDDYFPRVLDWDAIKKDEKAFINTVKGIYESLGIKGKVASGPNKGRLRSEVAAESYFNGHKTSGDSVFNAAVLKEMFSKSKSGVSKSGKKFIYAPVSEHITHQRALQGPYKLVEEVLEKNGYLVNDGKAVLSRVVNDSIKSIAFARQFGTHGELLQPFFQRIRDKYVVHSNLPTDKALSAANQEMKLVANTIDAYFDRYGTALTGAAKSSAGIIATLGNANMLGRVTISSLGDIIQPLQNSGSWRAILDGFRRTAIRQSKETGPAKALGLDLSNTIQQGLQRSAGFEGKNVILNNSWIGKSPTQTVNNIMFKALGLEWLTGFARRFAYNVGVSDAYYLSKTLNKLTAAGKVNSGRAKRITYFLNNHYEITTRQALKLGSAKTFDDAILNNLNKKAISDAGIKAANRDALIPQVDNRLLFTQSNNQWVRLMGQFLSWAQAKSAQTNRILQRIENGSAKTLIKTLAVLPIYSGVQSLREIAKHGEIVTDFDANSYKWWAEGARLSGMFGFLPELIANRFIGPGAREPWYLFAPAFTIIGAPGVAAKQFWDGNTDRALRTLNEKLAPLPNWRKRLWKLFTQGLPKSVKIGSGNITKELKPFELGGLVLRKRFKKGDVVEAAAMEDINLNQQEDMNIKDLASVATAATLATTGVDADINKAIENNIIPEQPEQPVKSEPSKVVEQSEPEEFQEALKESESSNNYSIVNTEGYMGAYQFGSARLDDYKKETGKEFDNKTFVKDKKLQDKVFEWHTNNIQKYITKNKLDNYIGKEINGVSVTLNGLIAVAHLGGNYGMRKFLESNGEYNPSDSVGTSLTDYLNKFK